MRIIKDDILEEKVNKAIGNIMEEYFENTNILKSDFNPMAEEPAKFKILIGKKEFFRELENDLKEVISKELEKNKEYNNNEIVELKTEEALKKLEKISSEKSRYSSYEAIEKLPFEFLIKHYNENKIEDKVTHTQLNIFLKLKKETFDESINQILEKKEDDKLYLDDIKEVLNSIAKFENELGKYRYFEEEQTILDEKEVGLAIDLKTFQKIKENDWYKMETRIAKEILIPNFEKNIFDFVEKVKKNFENDIISLEEFKKLAYKMIENKGDMSLLEANEILRDFKTFDNEKVIEEMLKVLPNVVERNDEDMKIIFADSFKEKMKEQLKELKETDIKEEKNYKKIKEYEKEL